MPDRLDKELEEILSDGTQDTGSQKDRRRSTSSGRLHSLEIFSRLPRTNIHPGKVMLASIAFLLVALILYNSALNHAGSLVWIAVAIFAGSYLLFFVNPNKSGHEKRWRGEVIESRASLLSRIKRLLTR